MVDPLSMGLGAAAVSVLRKGGAEKLIEVIAAGMGTLYRPTAIRKEARAEGDAKVILAAAEARASEVAMRAAHRLLDVETRRQENLDAILSGAQAALPDEVSDAPVHPDWTARFVREAQDVSDDQMRILWGKLLAGEVTKPGTFSPRTLAVVSTLTSRDAGLFQRLCGCGVRIQGIEPILLMPAPNAKYVLDAQLGADVVMHLEAAGLVQRNILGIATTEDIEQPIAVELPGDVLYLLTGPRLKFQLGMVSFTQAGKELFSLAEWTMTPGHEEQLLAMWASNNWKAVRHRIVERQASGRVGYVPWA